MCKEHFYRSYNIDKLNYGGMWRVFAPDWKGPDTECRTLAEAKKLIDKDIEERFGGEAPWENEKPEPSPLWVKMHY